MEKKHILYLVILIVIIVFIVVVKELKKDAEDRRYQEKKAAQERKEKSSADKFKANDTVCEWALKIADLIAPLINDKPYNDCEFHFKTYTSLFQFGKNLQDIYLKHVQKFISKEDYVSILVWNFSKNNLPDVPSQELGCFSKAMAELVAAELEKKEIAVKVRQIPRIVGDDVDDNAIFTVTYYAKKVEGNW